MIDEGTVRSRGRNNARKRGAVDLLPKKNLKTESGDLLWLEPGGIL